MIEKLTRTRGEIAERLGVNKTNPTLWKTRGFPRKHINRLIEIIDEDIDKLNEVKKSLLSLAKQD